MSAPERISSQRTPPPPSLFDPKPVNAAPSAAAKPKEGGLRRAFNYAWNLPWNVLHPAQAGAISAAEAGGEKVLKFLADEGPTLSNHLREILSKAIMHTSPTPLLILKDLLHKCLGSNKAPLTLGEIDQIKQVLNDLSGDALLNELSKNLTDENGRAVVLSDEAKNIIPDLLKRLDAYNSAEDEEVDAAPSDSKEPLDGKESKKSASDAHEDIRPDLPAETIALMRQVYQLNETLIRCNQGVLNNSTDFMAKFLERVITDEEEGFLKKLEKSLTHQEMGLFQRVLKWAKAKMKEDGGILSALNDELNSQPHPVLVEARNALAELSKAIKENAPLEKRVSLAKKVRPLIATLQKERETIFPRMPLTKENLLELGFLEDAIESLVDLGEDSSSLPGHVQKCIDILDEHFKREEGLVARSARVFMETIINKASEGPKKIMDYFKGPKKTEKAPEGKRTSPAESKLGLSENVTTPAGEPAIVKDPSNAEEMPLKEYLTSALGFLTSFISGASELVKKPALEAFGSSLLWILEGIRKRTENNNGYEQTHAIIEKLIASITEAKKNGDFNALVGAIRESVKEPKYLQIYLNGIKVPKLALDKNQTSSIAGFLSNIQKHEKALNKNPKKEMNKVNYDLLIEEEEKIFSKKTSAFGSMRLCCYISGITPPDDFYTKILQGSENTLKEQFVKSIEALSIPSFKKAVAKFLYRVIYPLAELIVKKTTSRFIKEMKQGIHKGFSGLEVNPFRRLSSYLSILGESYVRAANKPIGTLEESIVAELENPQYNKGFTSEKLYQAVSRKFIHQFTPQFEWTLSIGAWFKKLTIPKTSKLSFLNPVVRCLATVGSFVVCAIVYLPQKAVNKIMLWALKKFAVRTAIFDDILHKNVEALKSNNSYIYALNKVVYEQLETVWQIMQDAVIENGGLDLGSVGGAQSKMQVEELTILTKHLMEVLQKSKYHTPHELRKAIEDKSFFKSAREGAEALFINEAVDAATKLIGAVYKSLIPKDQLQKLFYNFITMINRSYSTGKEVTDEEYQSLEKGIDTLAAKIVTLAIQLSLEKRFDFTLSAQKQEADKFVKELQTQADDFYAMERKAVKKLKKAVTDFSLPSAERTFPQLLEKIITASIDFQRKRMSPHFDVNGNPNFDGETKKNLDKISEELRAKCTDFGEKVNRIEKLQQQIVLRQKNNEEFGRIQEILQNVQDILSEETITREGLKFCRTHLSSLDKIIKSLGQVTRLEEFSRDLRKLKVQLDENITELSKAIELDHSITALVAKSKKSPLYILILEKKLSIHVETKALTARKKEVKDLLRAVPDEQARSLLTKRVESILASSSTAELKRHSEVYEESSAEILQGAEERADNAVKGLEAASQDILKTLERSEEMNPDKIHNKVRRISSLIDETLASLNEIADWSKNVKPIAFFNPPLMNMGWVIDITKNLAYDEIEKVVAEFLKFAHKHYNFLGFIRHGVLIPYATDAI